MRVRTSIFVLVFSVFSSGCAILKAPQINKPGNLSQYRFMVLPQTNSLNSSSGDVYGNQHGIYGSSASKEVNPGQVIEGILLKRGIVSTESVGPGAEENTLLVKYGESGKRDIAGGFGGYTLEVTIALISAKTNEVVYSCTAEGQGSTEADDIREAIHRCLSGL
ncbi:MAG: DUF4136 domain-containing protein [Nitrosomonas sp.]|nr:DUF4136 domain-containing protein [Nitrosomonas sp.]